MGLKEKQAWASIADGKADTEGQLTELVGASVALTVDESSFATVELIKSIPTTVFGHLVDGFRNLCSDEIARDAVRREPVERVSVSYIADGTFSFDLADGVLTVKGTFSSDQFSGVGYPHANDYQTYLTNTLSAKDTQIVREALVWASIEDQVKSAESELCATAGANIALTIDEVSFSTAEVIAYIPTSVLGQVTAGFKDLCSDELALEAVKESVKQVSFFYTDESSFSFDLADGVLTVKGTFNSGEMSGLGYPHANDYKTYLTNTL